MKPEPETIIVDDSTAADESWSDAFFAKAVRGFSRAESIEIDLRNVISKEHCQLALDMLEGAFGLKRKQIRLKIPVQPESLANALVNMIKHSDVLTEVVVCGPPTDPNTMSLMMVLRSTIFTSTKVFYQYT